MSDDYKVKLREELKKIDHNSQEWKDYCEGLERLDETAKSSVYIAPNNEETLDIAGIKAFAKEHYDGDSNKMTDEEKDMFIVKRNSLQRKTA